MFDKNKYAFPKKMKTLIFIIHFRYKTYFHVSESSLFQMMLAACFQLQ